MNYRLLTRLLAVFCLLLSMFALVVIIYLAFIFIITVSGSDSQSQLNLVWLIFGVALLFCSFHVIASRRLLQATNRGINPQSVIKLCRMWLMLSWITIGIALIWFTVETIILTDTYIHGPEQRFSISWTHLMDITILFLQGMGMFCVYKFKNETNYNYNTNLASEYITETQAMMYLAQQNDYRTSQSSSPPPPYESLKFLELSDPPPAYNVIVGSSDSIQDD